MSKKTQVELKTELPDLVKSKGLVSTTKTTGDSMRTMLTDIIDSFTTPEDAALIAHNATGSVIPIGIIVMWSPLKSPSVDKDGGFGVSIGSIPKGWVVCDGSNGTPDMRDKFVVGAGPFHPVDVAKGPSGSITGSVKPHVLTLADPNAVAPQEVAVPAGVAPAQGGATSVEAIEDKALQAVQSIQAVAEEAAQQIMEAKQAPAQAQEQDLQEAQFSEKKFSDTNDTLVSWLTGNSFRK
jgi:hypothetical protein